MPKKRNSLSIIIVTFNSIDHIKQCLRSLAKAASAFSTQLLLIDNNSSDLTVSWFETHKKQLHHWFDDVIIIVNKTNTGYTRGINQGLEICNGDYILLLNPDIIVANGIFEKLFICFNLHPDVGIVAPQLRYPGGQIQSSCRRFPRKRDLFFDVTGLSRLFSKSAVLNRWKMPDFDHRRNRFVEQPQGAFLLADAGVVETVGLLDERFTMFFSDVDWCKRVIQNRFKIFFCAGAGAIHHKGASVNRRKAEMIVSSHRSFMDYMRKHNSHPRAALWLLHLMLLLITLPRVTVENLKL
ncbi:glycosyltransferase [candidate division KSB1 bacterium]|nr:glycosyltransferase [candidate division KSB1 bacterium]